MAERSARRPRRVAVVDAPSARAASLASSAALPRPPGDGLTRPSSEAVDPPGNPPVIPPGIPPATGGGGNVPRSPALLLVKAPSGGQSAAKTAADWPPSGEWCGRAARCASRD
jgi:hypothetical protein